jgi:hypothetical protein
MIGKILCLLCDVKPCLICGVFKKMNLRWAFVMATLTCGLGLNLLHRAQQFPALCHFQLAIADSARDHASAANAECVSGLNGVIDLACHGNGCGLRGA